MVMIVSIYIKLGAEIPRYRDSGRYEVKVKVIWDKRVGPCQGGNLMMTGVIVIRAVL